MYLTEGCAVARALILSLKNHPNLEVVQQCESKQQILYLRQATENVMAVHCQRNWMVSQSTSFANNNFVRTYQLGFYSHCSRIGPVWPCKRGQ